VCVDEIFSKEEMRALLDHCIENRGAFTGDNEIERWNFTPRCPAGVMPPEPGWLLFSYARKVLESRELKERVRSIGDYSELQNPKTFLTNLYVNRMTPFPPSPDRGEVMNWHDEANQHLAFLLYFFREPKRFTHGEYIFTDGKAVKMVVPENGRLVVMAGKTKHGVQPHYAENPESLAWEDARFVLAFWV